MDLDIALELSPANVERFRDVMESLGLRPLVPVPVEALADPDMVRIMVERDKDVFDILAMERLLREKGVGWVTTSRPSSAQRPTAPTVDRPCRRSGR